VTIPTNDCWARQRTVTILSASRTFKKVDLRDESPEGGLDRAPVLCTQSRTLSKKIPEKN
jgi:hypothetical protein